MLPRISYYEEAETEMLNAGFSLIFAHDIWGAYDFPSHSEVMVKFIQMLTGNAASEQEVRTAIAEVYGQNQQATRHMKFAVFKK